MVNVIKQLIKQKEKELSEAKSEQKNIQHSMSNPNTLNKNATLIKDTEDMIDMLENIKDCTQGQELSDFEKSVNLYQKDLRQMYASTSTNTTESDGIIYELGLWRRFKKDIIKQYKDLQSHAQINEQNHADSGTDDFLGGD